ncbi:MAG: hypothetical protein LC687_07715, partial [Actinobacteria bacterium]|nr:hypothetical protein [Actinomycetota bacterium]
YTTKEQDAQGVEYTTVAKFKSYPDWSHCFEDYGDIISRLSWYQDAEDAANIPRDFLTGLIAIRSADGSVLEPGWATDKDYFNKVWRIVVDYDLLDRHETIGSDQLELLIVYDGDRKLELSPKKHTIGMTTSGGSKLMVRVKPTSFWQRLRYLLS